MWPVGKLFRSAILLCASLLWISASAQNSQSGNAYTPNVGSLSQLPSIASGTLLGNSSGSTAAPSGLTAIPGGVGLPVLSNVGTSLYPIYQNQLAATITATNGSNTFTCVTGCSGFYVGALLYQSTAFPLNATVTDISGSPSIVVTKNASADVTAGIMSIGFNKFNTTSAILANNVATKNLYAGQASQNGSNWTDEQLPNYCNRAAVCTLGVSGSQANATFGLRTSDNTFSAPTGSINETILSINDNTGTSHDMWGLYIQTEALAGAGTSSVIFGVENDVVNQHTPVNTDPFSVNQISMINAYRLGCGAGVANQTSCTTALDIVNNGQAFRTGINFGSTALDHSVLTHPSAVSMPSGANGDALSWYRQTGYSLPAWQLYATNTTTDGNFISEGDAALAVGGTTGNWASIGKTATTVGNATDNPTFSVLGSGSVSFNGGGVVTVQALNASYVNVSSASTIPTTGIYRPASNQLGFSSASILRGLFDANGILDINYAVASTGTKPTVTGCSNTSTLGGATAGSYVSGTTGTCTVTITLPTGPTNGYACFAHDDTTAADYTHSAIVTTVTTLTISGTTVSGDKVVWGCPLGY
jgi:hypothetical protein